MRERRTRGWRTYSAKIITCKINHWVKDWNNKMNNKKEIPGMGANIKKCVRLGLTMKKG